MFDISGWDEDYKSYGRCRCWEGVPDDIKERVLKMMRELRSIATGISIDIGIWPISDDTKEFIVKHGIKYEIDKY